MGGTLGSPRSGVSLLDTTIAALVTKQHQIHYCLTCVIEIDKDVNAPLYSRQFYLSRFELPRLLSVPPRKIISMGKHQAATLLIPFHSLKRRLLYEVIQF